MTTINLGKIKPLYKGAYGAGVTYRPLDFVQYGAQVYVCKATSTGNLPTNTAFFDPVAPVVTAALLGLGNVDNTADAVKPISIVQQTALNAKANLASPTLTGEPAAPTAAAGTNTTQLATTAYALAAAGLRYGKNNILGTVSQSAGVPTGAVIERGSNANGEFVRWADGTQICTRTIAIGGAPAISLANGALFQSNADIPWLYPAAFITQPVIGGAVTGGLAFTWLGLGWGGSSSTRASFVALSTVPSGAATSVVLSAVGKWF